MPSIFSKIISGDIPSHKVAEDDEFLAFLDINPLVEGHTLVIPKIEVDYIFDLEDDLLSRMIIFAKEVSIPLRKAMPCLRIGVSVIGIEVPHAHIHLIPLNTMNDVNFSGPKLKPSPAELSATAERIKGVHT